jgi:hypothetical protein
MNPLVQLVIQELPGLISEIRSLFVTQNPGATPPTDAQVVAAYLAACASSIAVDDAWLASHPPTPVPAPPA